MGIYARLKDLGARASFAFRLPPGAGWGLFEMAAGAFACRRFFFCPDTMNPSSHPTLPASLSSPKAQESRARLARPVWLGPEGIRNILAISLPLIISNAAHSLNLFFDRTFLAWYSKDAFAATLQSGMLHWTALSLFFSTVMYASTFVAQYSGAKRRERIGPALWQGIYLAIVGGILMMFLAPLARPFFRWVGHEAPLPEIESQYFVVLTLGSPVFLIKIALSCYYTGLGRTRVVMAVDALGCLTNMVLNLWLIFSPPLHLPGGPEGAAIATVLAAGEGIIFYAYLIFRPSLDAQDHVLRGWRVDGALLRRLIRFGLPTGLHGLVDMTAFSVFMLVVGKFGFEAQFASNAAMNINLLLFIPAVGMAQAASILAGQFSGAKTPELTERLASGILLITGAYMLVACFLYLAVPEFFVGWFRGNIAEAEWQPILRLSKILLAVVAFYSMFDAMVLAISGVIKGAGDTKFVMLLSMVVSQILLTGPCLILVLYRDKMSTRTGLLLAWGFCSAYILFLAAAFLMRYLTGKWKTMTVIEEAPVPLSGADAAAISPSAAEENATA